MSLYKDYVNRENDLNAVTQGTASWIDYGEKYGVIDFWNQNVNTPTTVTINNGDTTITYEGNLFARYLYLLDPSKTLYSSNPQAAINAAFERLAQDYHSGSGWFNEAIPGWQGGAVAYGNIDPNNAFVWNDGNKTNYYSKDDAGKAAFGQQHWEQKGKMKEEYYLLLLFLVLTIMEN